MPFPARRALALAAALALGAPLVQAATPLKPCRVDGIATELQCGSLQRPLDPARPDGPKIDVNYVVVPALARNKQPDAVLLLAGGPGQGATKLASRVLPRLSRLNNRRDLVFIDQRGTGSSAPLQCPDDSKLPITEQLDPAAQLRRIEACRVALEKLPYGDLRFFTTTIAMQDMDAVREQLGVPQWNLVGASYGTRADVPLARLNLTTLPSDEPTAKGIAEAVLCPIAPAIGNAIAHATARRFRALPITAADIAKALS